MIYLNQCCSGGKRKARNQKGPRSLMLINDNVHYNNMTSDYNITSSLRSDSHFSTGLVAAALPLFSYKIIEILSPVSWAATRYQCTGERWLPFHSLHICFWREVSRSLEFLVDDTRHFFFLTCGPNTKLFWSLPQTGALGWRRNGSGISLIPLLLLHQPSLRAYGCDAVPQLKTILEDAHYGLINS